MIDVIRECRRLAKELRSTISRLKARHINRETVLEEARGLVDGYFRTDRPLLVEEFPNESLFQEVDALMQDLLRLTQARTLKSRYLQNLGSLEKAWGRVELHCLPLARKMVGNPRIRDTQYAMLRTLEGVCPTSAVCYQQALWDLADSGRKSWRGTATELREALRELLDKLAPDEAITQSPGFKLEDGAKAPTMRQKTRFILKSRKWSESVRKPVEDATGVVEEKVGNFVRSVYTKSSSSVHVERSKQEVLSVLRFVETAFAELLELEGT